MNVLKKLIKILCVLLKILIPVIGVLFVVYFWNLDQKLMGWLYKVVNKIFDRKKTDIQF